MELYDLGKEYLKRSEELIEHIHELNKRCDELDGSERTVLKRRIYSLYCDAAHCRDSAIILMSYGKRGESI